MKKLEVKKRLNKVVCLKNEMDNFVKYLGLDEKLEELKILEVWKECVGDIISQNSKPIELKGNKLLVRVENAVWRFELSLKKREIINKLNIILEKEKGKKNKIKEIVFI